MNPKRTIHERILLRIDEALGEPHSPYRDEVTGGLRADRLANAMEGEEGRAAADYAYAIRDLRNSGDIADLSRLRLTEEGAIRVRALRSPAADHNVVGSKPMIDRNKLSRGPEPYLGWWLEGTPGPAMHPRSYICFASEDRGESRFQVTIATASAKLSLEGGAARADCWLKLASAKLAVTTRPSATRRLAAPRFISYSVLSR